MLDSLKIMFSGYENKLNQIREDEPKKVTEVDFGKKNDNMKSLEMLFPE